ncbi:MAG: sulfite exporter TauE/SafE family protein, partial [Proteobacteria bacterium]|nr:sulfite exporter TauE/SafE family protein [Pseudomonadota bacterium]
MNIYLPIAEISINIYLLLALGLSIGFLSGLFGIGGGFIASPLLILAGVPATIAVGTTTIQVFASSLTGAMNHLQKKNVDFQMVTILIIGGFIGTLIGVYALKRINSTGLFENYLYVFYAVILSLTALFILYESAKENTKKRKGKFKLHDHSWIHRLPLKIKFRKSKLYISIFAPLTIGFFIGILTGFTGIGGGFILVPCMIYILGMKTVSVIGTSLFNITVVSLISVVLQVIINQNLDFILALILIVSSSLGAALASRFIEKIKIDILKDAFGFLIL